MEQVFYIGPTGSSFEQVNTISYRYVPGTNQYLVALNGTQYQYHIYGSTGTNVWVFVGITLAYSAATTTISKFYLGVNNSALVTGQNTFSTGIIPKYDFVSIG